MPSPGPLFSVRSDRREPEPAPQATAGRTRVARRRRLTLGPLAVYGCRRGLQGAVRMAAIFSAGEVGREARHASTAPVESRGGMTRALLLGVAAAGMQLVHESGARLDAGYLLRASLR